MHTEIKRLLLLAYWHTRRCLIWLALYRVGRNYNGLINAQAWVARELATEICKQADGGKAYAEASATIRALNNRNMQEAS